MEVLVKYESGFRFSAVCRGHTVTTGRGEDDHNERDGMWPAQLFEASIGMCIGGHVAKFCKEQGISYDNITIELSRRIQADPSCTTRINAKINLDTELSAEQRQGILKEADCCHITNSIRKGMQIVCSFGDAGAADAKK